MVSLNSIPKVGPSTRARRWSGQCSLIISAQAVLLNDPTGMYSTIACARSVESYPVVDGGDLGAVVGRASPYPPALSVVGGGDLGAVAGNDACLTVTALVVGGVDLGVVAGVSAETV